MTNPVSVNLGSFPVASGTVFSVVTDLGTFHISRVGVEPTRTDYIVGASIQKKPMSGSVEVEDFHPLEIRMDREVTVGQVLRYGKDSNRTANLGVVRKIYMNRRRVTALIP